MSDDKLFALILLFGACVEAGNVLAFVIRRMM